MKPPKLKTKLNLMRSKEIAQKLGFHHKTIESWARSGHIPSIRIGGSVRFDEMAVMGKLERGGK